jgi:NADPH:quinone reductase-like Zn-dependent oxidoreductase
MAAPKIPVTMRATAVDRFGPPAVLTPHTLPVPNVRPRDVLIAVHAAGVGVWVVDAKLRVPIAAVYSLTRAATAHETLERGHVLGRMVLQSARET